jgi:NADPH:quinone reductase-like Zn-dependent oxidoreductase
VKAFRYSRYGGPEVLELSEVDKPRPKANEVLVRVRATTVTAGDWRMRRADPFLARLFNGLLRPKKVLILGFELAGEIEELGSGVTSFALGDAVFASCGFGFGAHAEYKCLPADGMLALKPANMTFEEAATVPIGALTALRFLRAAAVQPGHQILIYGASGSVGTYAVQIAKHLGAVVTGVCSTSNLDLVRALGADHVIDYTRVDFSEHGRRFDVVFDTVGKADFSRCLSALQPRGTYLCSFHTAIFRGLWASATSAKKVIGKTVGEDAEQLSWVKTLIEAGKLRSVIDRRYPFEQLPEAHRYVEQGHKRGNVVITMACDSPAASPLPRE